MPFGAKPQEGLTVAAKHRMPELPEQRPASDRRGLSQAARACDIISASMVCAACVTALLLNAALPEKRTVTADLGPPAISEPVSQEGTVVGVTADSVTMRGADGRTQTYRFTPNTAVITGGARQPVSAAAHFAVNDHVVVVGTTEDGTAVAAAVAARGAGHGGGPPMDYLGDQAPPSGHT